jgi:hypothetical protein
MVHTPEGATLMYEAGVVDILDPITDEVINHCSGPTADGGCPRAGRDGVVPCNGYRVAGQGSGPEYWNLFVPPDSQHCPGAWKLEALGY